MAFLMLAMLLFPSMAVADEVVCVPGSDDGQCSSPRGVAVDRSLGLLYIADDGNQEVDVFDADDGTFLDSFPVGASLGGIAVDNDLASTAHGDVYVFDATNNRVLRFHPDGALAKVIGEGLFASQPKIALGPGGILHVADNIGGGNRRVQKFSHEGSLLATCSPLPPGEFGGNLMGFAVDSTGGFYIANAGGRPIETYDSSCSWLNVPFHTSFNIQTLALDAADNLFVADVTEAETSIYRYDATNMLTKVFYGDGTLQTRAISLAPLSTTGDVFAAEGSGDKRVVHVEPPLPGPVVYPDPKETFADPIGNTKATLHAGVNPEGKATKYHFQYVDDASYDTEGGFASPNTKTTAEANVVPPPDGPGVLAEVPSLFRISSVSTEAGCKDPENPPQPSCLAPETVYHFRAVAISADGGPRFGPEVSFETRPPFEILTTWATEVGADAATLNAEVNPLNIALSGRFQYVDEVTYLKDVNEGGEGFEHAAETGPIDFGAGEEPIEGSAQVHSLAPAAGYRYRIVVENAFGQKEAGPTLGFRTFPLPTTPPHCVNDSLRIGAAARLPDCRAYEMVSPVDKGGGDVFEGGNEGGPQSAAHVPGQGRGFLYASLRAFGDAVSAPYLSQYLASRFPFGHPEAGWRSHGISPPREGVVFGGERALGPQYKAFAEDLSWGVLRSDSDPPLDEGAILGYANLYRRDNATDDYEALCPVAPRPSVDRNEYSPEPQGFSADAGVTVFRVDDQLSPEAAAGSKFQTYACREGTLEVVSVLPPSRGGAASPGHSSVGTRLGILFADSSVHNAVSDDGERIYWTDSGLSQDKGQGRIYLRERPFAEGAECAGPAAPCTVEVSEAVEGAGSDQKAHFWTAASDGSVAIFSFTEGPLAGNLYEFDAATQTASPSPIAEGVSGVAGFSEDASRLYLVSTKALAGGALPGEPNLYFREPGEPLALVASLPRAGVGPDDGYCTIDHQQPTSRCSRATPDGQALAFVSQDQLTDYDNTDAASGEAAAEVYLYDARANDGEGQLLCASCNPSGARPRAKRLNRGGSALTAIAAQVPTWSDSLYAARPLSGDGERLFFESYDPLVLTDTNGALDVYQWEAAGKGGCEASDPSFSVQNGGCVELISTGRSPLDSTFADASADGEDVFFTTAASILPQDPGLIDVYDARVQGGFPPPPPADPECEGEACQSPPPAPQAPTPASSSFAGEGDPKAKRKPRRCPKGKRRVVRRGKARCANKKRGGRR